ncbi:MAG: carboxypeptidase-like regulatory domain-containing protein [Treponema sp.]|nr:carboxypeptidase-like regulatory domain-containing protein [Treponema sp.]
MKNKIILIIIIFLASSCKTAEFGYKTVDISGMIYDFSNKPVPFYNISLGKKYKSSTDINGRFIFQKVPAGNYSITGNKLGYETHADEINIIDNRQIIYIRVPSQKQLLDIADEALTRNDLQSAEEMLERAFLIERNNIEMLIYFAAVKYRQNNYERAVFYLENAQKLGSKDIYIEKFLNKIKELQNEM